VTGPIYERIGRGYSAGRREDPRIAAHVHAGLGDSDRVVNVGAGTGSYEPRDRHVVAVEPSHLMAAQRQATAAPVVRAVAEAMPFPDRTFDAALGVLTIHHWTSLQRGLGEVRRIAARIVLFLRDPAAAPSWWLYDYFPATARLVAARETPLPRLESLLRCRFSVTPVPIPADCVDGFEAAYWRRPAAFLDPNVCASMSALSLISPAEREMGQRRLAGDLANGTWIRRYGGLIHSDQLDLGYRVVSADL
jgi:SAM-dependent methyltransferase